MGCSPVVRRLLTGLSLLGLLNGCASKPTRSPEIRTITSVGGSPEAVVAGVPGASRNSAALLDDRPLSNQERISGRVVDERGRPMPNVEVRLADGSAAVGRDITSTTDDAGGFTLKGVRPGRRYTLVAESDRGKHWYFGRVRDVEAPERLVEIEVHDQTPQRSSRRVGRVTEADPDESNETSTNTSNPSSGSRSQPNRPSRVNEDDMPPARPADDLPNPPFNGPSNTPRPAPIDPGRDAWQAVGQAAFSQEIRSNNAPGEVLTSAEASTHDLETENPLPPAKEPPATRTGNTSPAQGSAFSRTDERQPAGPEPSRGTPPEDVPFTSGSGPLITEFGSADPGPAATKPAEPAQMESQIAPAQQPAATNPAAGQAASSSGTGPSPTETPGPNPTEAPPSLPTSPLGFPPSGTAEPGATAPEPPGLVQLPTSQRPPEAGAEHMPRTTWSDLALEIEPDSTATLAEVPIAAGAVFPRSTRRSGSKITRADITPEPQPSQANLLANQSGTSTPKRILDPAAVTVSCKYDSRRKRLVDFEIPNIDGSLVNFSKIDADYILLDFWGSWCGPCLKAAPHLVELQRQYDPKRFQVVGIAYETGPQPERLANALAASETLNLNYPVLIGESDGKPCPLATALNVNTFPTMILLDRHGRILWRDSGASPPTLQRLDRVVASSVRNSTSRDTVRR